MPEKSDTSKRSVEDGQGNFGILDPAEPRHFLPEGLERKRKGPLNWRTGRRPDTGAVQGETS